MYTKANIPVIHKPIYWTRIDVPYSVPVEKRGMDGWKISEWSCPTHCFRAASEVLVRP